MSSEISGIEIEKFISPDIPKDLEQSPKAIFIRRKNELLLNIKMEKKSGDIEILSKLQFELSELEQSEKNRLQFEKDRLKKELKADAEFLKIEKDRLKKELKAKEQADAELLKIEKKGVSERPGAHHTGQP